MAKRPIVLVHGYSDEAPSLQSWASILAADECDYQPQQDGELSCYPNDAWFKYRNNRGRLTLSVQRIA